MFNPICGWEDTHLINEYGEVVVKDRWIKKKNGHLTLLKQHPLKWHYQKGYPTVCLYAHGRMKRYFIHRLVYETFVKKVPNGMQINHIDGVKNNNHLDNLELVTPLENTRHAWKMGLITKSYGEKCSTSKLKDDDVRKIKKMFSQGTTQKELSETYKVHQTTIHYIIKGKTWSHVT